MSRFKLMENFSRDLLLLCADMENENNELAEISNRSYKKLKENATKNGYADGISDGRDSVYQLGFDRGFENGFKNAFVLGQQQGRINAVSDSHPEAVQASESDSSLANPRRGHCLICVDQTKLNHSIQAIEQWHDEHFVLTKATLSERYKEINKLFKYD